YGAGPLADSGARSANSKRNGFPGGHSRRWTHLRLALPTNGSLNFGSGSLDFDARQVPLAREWSHTQLDGGHASHAVRIPADGHPRSRFKAQDRWSSFREGFLRRPTVEALMRPVGPKPSGVAVELGLEGLGLERDQEQSAALGLHASPEALNDGDGAVLADGAPAWLDPPSGAPASIILAELDALVADEVLGCASSP